MTKVNEVNVAILMLYVAKILAINGADKILHKYQMGWKIFEGATKIE